MPGYYRNELPPIDVAMCQVSPMDKHGYFSFGPSGAMQDAAFSRAKYIIVEVNPKLPRCIGNYQERIPISRVNAIVEMKDPYVRCMGEAKPSTEVDLAVAKQIVKEIPNGACLQLGIGGMPNAVGSLLAESDLKDLGVHTEMYVDSYVKMAERGIITGAQKGTQPRYAGLCFCFRTQELYDYLDDNPTLHGNACRLCQ
jgi:acyl-CoA hydrolase